MSVSNKIVSVVDDERDITDLFSDVLSTISGVSVLTFNDSIEAFKHFSPNKEEYVLVLTDFRMPGINGLELLRKVKKLNPHVRTILMSAFDIETDPIFDKSLKDQIINLFFEKPITISRLRDEVNSQIQTFNLSFERK